MGKRGVGDMTQPNRGADDTAQASGSRELRISRSSSRQTAQSRYEVLSEESLAQHDRDVEEHHLRQKAKKTTPEEDTFSDVSSLKAYMQTKTQMRRRNPSTVDPCSGLPKMKDPCSGSSERKKKSPSKVDPCSGLPEMKNPCSGLKEIKSPRPNVKQCEDHHGSPLKTKERKHRPHQRERRRKREEGDIHHKRANRRLSFDGSAQMLPVLRTPTRSHDGSLSSEDDSCSESKDQGNSGTEFRENDSCSESLPRSDSGAEFYGEHP